MKKAILLILPFIIIFSEQLWGQCTNPNAQFEFYSSMPPIPTIFCEGGVVEIDNRCDEFNPLGCIDHMTINWDYPNGPVEPFTDFNNRTHVYDFTDSVACLLTDSRSFLIQLRVYYHSGLTNSIIKEVAVRPKPVAQFHIDETICLNMPNQCVVNNSCADSMWIWLFKFLPNGIPSTYTTEEPCHEFNQLGDYRIDLIAKNDCGSDTMTQIIQVIDTIKAQGSLSPLTGCNTMTVTLTDQSDTPTSVAISRKWDINPDTGWEYIDSTNEHSRVAYVNFTEPGDYTISLEVVSICNTNSRIIGEVHLAGSPSAQISNLTDGCMPHSITPTAINVEFANSNSNNQILWEFEGGIPSMGTGANPGTIQYSNAGVFEVKLSIINECDTVVYVDTVTIIQPPVAIVALNSILAGECLPFTAIVDNNSLGGTPYWSITPNTPGAYTYANGTNSTSEDPQIVFHLPGIYVLNLFLDGGDCGSVTWSDTIVIHAAPTVNLASIPSICEGEQIMHSASIIENGCEITSCQWSFPGGSPSSFTGCTPPVVTYDTPGNYTAILTATNCCGTTIDSQAVVVNGIPVANVSIIPPGNVYCAPQTLTFQNMSLYNTNNDWDILPATGWSGNLNVASPVVAFNTPGTYVVTLNISAGGCGADSLSDTIVIHATPTVNLASIPSICEGEQIMLSASIIENGCEITSCHWSFPGGSPSSSTDCIPPPVTYNTLGNYFATLTVINCCDTTIVSRPVVVTGIPVANVSIMPPGNIYCAPQTLTFQNTSVFSQTDIWGILPGNGWNGNLNVASPIVTFTTPGIYIVTLNIPENGCGSDSWSDTIVIHAPPTVNLASIPSICEGEQILPSASIIENGCEITSCYWSFPGGNPSSSADCTPPPVTYDTPGNYIATLTVINCCDTTIVSRPVVVEDYVEAIVPDTLELCEGDLCETLSGIPNTGCTWSMDGVVLLNNQFCPNNAGTFRLIYTCGPDNCASRDTMMVIVHPRPSITFVPLSFSICKNAPPVQLMAIPENTNTWWTGNGIDAEGWFDPALPGAGGIMTYHHRDTITGCENTMTLSITVSPLLELNLPDSTFCNAAQIVLENEYEITEGPGEACTWSGNGILNPTDGTFVLPQGTVLPATFPIYYTYTTNADCSVIDSIIIMVVELDTAYAGEDVTLCAEGIHQLVGNLSAMIWTGSLQMSGPPVSSTGIINLALAPVGVHTYTYTGTAYAGSTCETSDQINVTIVNLASINAGNDQHYCVTDGIVTLPFPTVPSGNTVVLSGQGVVDSLLGHVNVSLIPVGTCATLTYTVSSNTLAECATSAVFQLCVYDLPAVDFSILGDRCLNSQLMFENFSSGATKYRWHFGDGSISTAFQPNHSYSLPGDYTIVLEAWSEHPLTGDTLCISSDTTYINIPPIPEGSLVVTPVSGCESTTLYFNGTSISGGTGYKIHVGDDPSFYQISDSVVVQASADTTSIQVTLTITDFCNPDTSSLQVIIPPIFNASFALDSLNNQTFIFCPPYEASFINLSTGLVDSFVVNYGNGQSSVNDFIPAIFDNLTDSTVTYIVQLVIFNDLCPPDTAQLELMILPYSFEAGLQAMEVAGCQGTPLRFIPLVSPWIDTVVFNPGNGLGALLVVPGDTLSYIYPQSGVFYPTLTATDGCAVISSTVQVSIHASPSFTLIADTETCIDKEITVAILPNSPIMNPVIIFPDTSIHSQVTDYTPTMAGQLAIRATVLDSISLCPGEEVAYVEVYEYAGLPIGATFEVVCDHVLIHLTHPVDEVIVDNTTYFSPVDTASIITIPFPEPGNHFVQLILSDNQGCETKKIESFETIENTISLDAGRDTFINFNTEIQLQPSLQGGIPPFDISWSIKGGGIAAMGLNPIVKPPHSGFYILTVTDWMFCSASDSIYIQILDGGCKDLGVYVPNVFSPNGDGINDILFLQTRNGIDSINAFSVFDRWGNLVFENKNFIPNDPIYGWNGKSRNKEMDSAVFVWFHEIRLPDGSIEICKGDVTLIR